MSGSGCIAATKLTRTLKATCPTLRRSASLGDPPPDCPGPRHVTPRRHRRGVQRLEPDQARTSIQPVVQGMTRNAGRGPQQPCGKVRMRTDQGWDRVLAADPLEKLASA
jgi:hypothetical protein